MYLYHQVGNCWVFIKIELIFGSKQNLIGFSGQIREMLLTLYYWRSPFNFRTNNKTSTLILQAYALWALKTSAYDFALFVLAAGDIYKIE